MKGLFGFVRRRVTRSLPKRSKGAPKAKNMDGDISLGILIRGVGAVAEADKKFRPEEEKRINEILLANTTVTKGDLPVVIAAIRQSAFGRNDFYNCVRAIRGKLSEKQKISVMENLVRVACADKNISAAESRVIKRVAGLLHVKESQLNNIKTKIKKESGCKK